MNDDVRRLFRDKFQSAAQVAAIARAGRRVILTFKPVITWCAVKKLARHRRARTHQRSATDIEINKVQTIS